MFSRFREAFLGKSLLTFLLLASTGFAVACAVLLALLSRASPSSLHLLERRISFRPPEEDPLQQGLYILQQNKHCNS